MAADEKWYFTKEQLATTPSTKCGYDADRELSCRQQAAHLIQDMGQRLQVSQLCINTAMVYMHRFYVFHSFTQFHLDAMAAAALFLAAKVEEQPRKLEHVIKVKNLCLNRDVPHKEIPPLDVRSEQYLEQAQDLVFNENVLLQTLGFDVAIDHPHTHVVRCCHLVRASKDLAQTSYFMASNSLHLTTMCLQYKPTVVACFCIHLACKWSNWEIPQSNEGRYWFYYVDKTVTQELLEQLTDEFLVIFEKCPSRLKKKIKSANQNPPSHLFANMSQGQRDTMHEGVSFQSHHRPQGPNRPSTSQPPQSSSQRTDSREHQEKRDRERQMASQSSHSQHRDGHHRSHHMGHPHPTSSSLMKPHTNMPVHNKAPHPGQHRSSSLPHPRPDHHSRPDHLQRPDHQSRPDHPQRPDYQQRQERQSRPEHGNRSDHHPRGDHPMRPDQVRTDHHQARTDHQLRADHQTRPDQQRPDHHSRPDHQNRPEHQARTEHPFRPDHSGSQPRSDHQPRPDPSVRPDQSSRQDHIARSEHQGGVERHDRLDGHPEQRHSAVTAARDQLRRDAALQREAGRREALHTIPGSLMNLNHSPAQRTTSGDSAISSSSSTSLTPSNQDWSGFGVTSAVSGGPSPLPPKQAGPAESNHRHSTGYEKPKTSNLSVDSYARHRSSLPGTDRRPNSASVSSEVTSKMMQMITERRQLESFFGKSETQERINEKHQVKHPPSVPYKEVKKEPETVQMQQQLNTVPSVLHIKREKISPAKQLTQSTGLPTLPRNDSDMTAPSLGMRQNNYKSVSSEYPLIKNIKTEPDNESLSDTRNGTSMSALLVPKVEKIEADLKGESSSMSNNRLPPVKSSIFSPEKPSTKEREPPISQRAVKICPPSPGIAFGSPPASTTTTSLQGRTNVTLAEERQSMTSPQLPMLQDARPLMSIKNTDVRTSMPLVPIEGDLGAVAFPASESKDLMPAPPSDEGSSADHHHHKSKKKKDKKEKHKHKDKDKDKEKHREEKKHKSKHKEKDKERRKAEAISAEMSQVVAQPKPESLKMKIPKAKITPPPAPAVATPPGGGLKLKIKLSSAPSGSSSSTESRKRERDRSSPGAEHSHSKIPKFSNLVETPKRGGNSDVASHGIPGKSSYARQNGLESRGGNRHHMQHPQHYGGSKMVMDDGSSLKPSEISKNSSSHSSTS